MVNLRALSSMAVILGLAGGLATCLHGCGSDTDSGSLPPSIAHGVWRSSSGQTVLVSDGGAMFGQQTCSFTLLSPLPSDDALLSGSCYRDPLLISLEVRVTPQSSMAVRIESSGATQVLTWDAASAERPISVADLVGDWRDQRARRLSVGPDGSFRRYGTDGCDRVGTLSRSKGMLPGMLEVRGTVVCGAPSPDDQPFDGIAALVDGDATSGMLVIWARKRLSSTIVIYSEAQRF